MPEIKTVRPSNMTAEQYREYQGGEIIGYMQSYIYCSKILQEIQEQEQRYNQQMRDFCIGLSEDTESTELLSDYEPEDCIETDVVELIYTDQII